MKAVVVGGGIAGLTAAYRLACYKNQPGASELEVTLLEASARLGGVISTTAYEGAVIEEGPDSMITNKPWALDLCREIALGENIIATNEKHRRALIAFRGRLHPIPAGFNLLAPSRMSAVWQSKLFSPAGKLRMALEMLQPSKPVDGDESLASFVRRRLGQEVLERVAQPLAGGIYTADPEYLSLKATLPRFLELEQKYGSVIRGLKAEEAARLQAERVDSSAEAGGARYSMFVTLDGGMQMLVDRLEEKLSTLAAVRRGCAMESFARISSSDGSTNWRISLSNGETLAADIIVFALPAQNLANQLRAHDQQAARLIDSIQAASSAVLTMVYKKKDVKRDLDGFGFVVPAIERRSLIACSFSSVKFPGRAPEHCVSLRVFMGGAMQAHIYALDDARMVKLARKDLKHYLGVRKEPIWSSLKRWPRSMPQYRVGHLDLVNQIEERVAALPGLFVCGSAFRGVGIPDCVRSGERAAQQALDLVKKAPAEV